MALYIGGVAVDATAAEIDVLDGLDRGSIIYGNASSATTVLGQGNADEVLTSDGTDIAWAAAGGGGITHASQWRITSNHTGAGFLTANWEETDVNGAGALGSAMTESSGVFTFPSTGFWLIDFAVFCADQSTNRYIGANIFTTNNASGAADFNEVSKAYNNIYYDTGDPYYCTASSKFLFDVDVLADDKIKFFAHAADAAAEHGGNTSSNITYVTFLRLGDT
ncbi:MAG: hypothetical protein QF535_16650 [Anaerolineales bacterium]|nr:hypothetical protein [Anaerolineales bacterium]